jgi:uncharacterized protein DUF4416
MGAIRNLTPVQLFIGILVCDAKFISEIETRLAAAYGPIDHRSAIIPFTFTSYYTREMGQSIDRLFLSFERLIEPDQLPEIKRQTNGIEQEIAQLQNFVRRPVNLDPGYLEQAKVILASTKNFYHRIYLGKGIFGEVTMHFKNNAYEFFSWTYPDYQSQPYQKFFLELRQIYRAKLRTMCINNPGG